MGSDESKGTGGDNHPGETLNRDALWRCGDGFRRVKIFSNTRDGGDNTTPEFEGVRHLTPIRGSFLSLSATYRMNQTLMQAHNVVWTVS